MNQSIRKVIFAKITKRIFTQISIWNKCGILAVNKLQDQIASGASPIKPNRAKSSSARCTLCSIFNSAVARTTCSN
jgi:hypothetical protein